MQDAREVLSEVRELYRKVLGSPAPEVPMAATVPFPPGVDPLRYAMQEVEHLKALFGQMPFAPSTPGWVPRADSYVAPDACVFRVEVPGVAREDLKVFVDGGECVVRGEVKPPESGTDVRPLNVERPWGPFERRFLLPAGSHPDRVTARCHDGVLEVRVAVEAGRKEMKVEAA